MQDLNVRRIAVSRLMLSDGKVLTNQVVELKGNLVQSYYPLQEELPMTKWLKGSFALSADNRLVRLP